VLETAGRAPGEVGNIVCVEVSDDEYQALSKHPGYHYQLDGDRADKEAQNLPPHLQGRLERRGQNIVLLPASEAAVYDRRIAECRAQTENLFRDKGGDAGNGQIQAEVPATAGELPPAALEPKPTPRFPVGWWRQFIFGTETDTFSRADAIQCIELVLAELGISTRDKVINFADRVVTALEFQNALSQLTGGELGWKTLTLLYRREFQHGRTDHQC
jgi:hypothetical protein